MSSQAARTAINAAVVAAAAPWPVFDLSDYNTIEEVLATIDAQAVLVQYVIAEDTMMSIGGEGNQGYEETGTATLHLVTPTGFDSSPVIDKGDEIRLAIRGRRSGQVVIESCSPFVDFGGGSSGIQGAWKSYSGSIYYYSRDCG